MPSARMRQFLIRLLPEYLATSARRFREPPAQGDWAAVQLDVARRAWRGDLPYPQYLYGMLAAARTAQACGREAFSAIEFGVAGGNGLVAIEHHADHVQRLTGIKVQVHGFDTGGGLPSTGDPLDCPFAFRGGEFRMDEGVLRSRLKKAKLWLGDVREQVVDFIASETAPIGFISNDFDYYTSTRDSFECLRIEPDRLLPRVSMYFDDLAGYPYSTLTGEWAAITEFNLADQRRQIAQVWGLKFQLGAAYRHAWWNESMFVLHLFDHGDYSNREEAVFEDLRLQHV